MSARARSALALSAAALALALSAAPAAAEPAFGLQLIPTSTPVTHSDERLAYQLTVKNTASPNVAVGDVLTCIGTPVDGHDWFGKNPTPTLEVQWLRNGQPIPGTKGPVAATPGGNTYTTTSADEGKSLQCEVVGTSDPDGADSTYAPISHATISLPPVAVETVPSPPPPSGSLFETPTVTGPVASTPTGTATLTAGSNLLNEVVTTKGTGTLTAGSKTVTGLSTTSGVFTDEFPKPAVTGTGVPGPATGTGTLNPNSNLITGVTSTSGKFVVGQEIRGKGISEEVTIIAVGPTTLELSGQFGNIFPTATSFHSYTTITDVGPGTLELSAPATVSGSQSLSGGASPFSSGQAVSGPGIPAVVATGSGDVEAGSTKVITLSTSTGSFALGQLISGTGIPASTRVAAMEPGTLILSTPATATGNGIALTAKPGITNVEGQRIELSDPVTATASGVAIAGKSEFGCRAPTGWSGTGLTWSLQWLRNGVPIAGATSPDYVVQKADTEPPSNLQCLATVRDAAGNEVVAISRLAVATAPRPRDPYGMPASSGITVTFNNKTTGKVTVEMQLPQGTKALRVSDKDNAHVSEDWDCAKAPPTETQPSTATCSREDPLQPGASYSPINLIAQVAPDAPDSLTTKATVSGGGAPAAAVAEDTVAGILAAVPFGFQAFDTEVLDEAGADFTQAGGHPFAVGANLKFTEHTRAEESAEAGLRAANGAVREIKTDTPAGFVGNPQAITEKCPSAADVVELPSSCPAASAVGGIDLEVEQGKFRKQPIYAIEPEYGTPAQLAFGVAQLRPGFGYTLTPELRPAAGYAISVLAAPTQKFPELWAAKVTLCDLGAKTGVLPDSEGETKFLGCNKAGDGAASEIPFLSLPTRCGDPESATTRIYADTWEERGKYAQASFTGSELTGCSALAFEPTLKARPTTNAADSPTGLDVDIHIPQSQDPEGTATAHLKKVELTLPEGLVVNPASANGLDACSPAQVGLGTHDPVTCPNASKLGTVSAQTPLLDHSVAGALYLASPHENPFGSLLALYLVIEDPQSGTVIKLPGKVEADPRSGQITNVFDNNPQLPVEDVEVKLRSGAAAPLRTPSACGKYSTASSLTPWSAPESGPPAKPKDNWSIAKGPGGGACAAPPNAPAFEAGTASPIAAAYSPFVVKLRREDGSQNFAAVSITPPPGLLGKLAGIPYCPDSAVAAAAAKSGHEEQASPSCPAASQVGSVLAGAGAGPAPYYATGKAYLTGPYKGAPISLAIVTPALAGPFDLGNVVVKTALNVDPETAKITAVSDPLPQILQGIPLDIRSVAISMDRPDFTLNPTSCDPMAVTGTLTSSTGALAPLSNRFQVGECSRLGFKPNLQIKLKGKTQRSGHPALTATVTYPKGAYANIASASVALPHSEFLEQGHIKTICTRVQFAVDACPQGAVYGKATAITPLLDAPLSGPVYLRSSSNPLPDLVVDLRGQIHVALVGRIDSVHGGIRTTFASVPDAPVSKFTLQMQGGKKGLLVNSRDICKRANRAVAEFTAQNGKAKSLRPELKAGCKPGRKSKRKP